MTKITKVKIIPIKVPYKKPLSISVGTISEANNVIVKIYTNNKIEGFGEASPFIFGYSKENQKSIVKSLKKIAPHILQKNPFDIEKIHEIMDKIITGNTCAKSAVDIALYDLMGKISEVPIYQLIGGKSRKKIPLLYAVDWTQGVGKMAKEAKYRVSQGYRGIMVKIGNGIKKDLSSIKLVREAIGKKTPIIADPNQAYSSKEAIQLTKRIYKYIQALEGPVKGGDISGLKKVKNLNLIPIIADESLFCLNDALILAKENAADMFLIKLLKVGGFYKAKQILTIAQEARIKCYAASMTNLGIGHAANLHFAALPDMEDKFGFGFENLFQIFGSEEEIEEKNISDIPKFESGSYEVPQKPGLGITLKEKNIKKYAIAEIAY